MQGKSLLKRIERETLKACEERERMIRERSHNICKSSEDNCVKFFWVSWIPPAEESY